MTSNLYLYSILSKYKASDLTGFDSSIAQLKAVLKNWANQYYVEILESGSRAKNTAISISSDVDYVVSLTSNCNANNGGLRGIFNSLYATLSQKYSQIRKQNVSVRVHLFGATLLAGTIEVDVTPARLQSSYSNDHSIYLSKNDTWKQTNIHKHNNDIRNSGRTNEIKLLKIWRELNKLEFPSIYLEYLLVEEILRYKPTDSDKLESNFFHVLNQLASSYDNPLHKRIVDPANSNNILSDLLSQKERLAIINAAKASNISSYWENIIW